MEVCLIALQVSEIIKADVAIQAESTTLEGNKGLLTVTGNKGLITLFGIKEGDVYLSPAPLYHAAPLAFSTAQHRVGATVVAMRGFDAEEALRLIQDYQVTASQWVPTHFRRLLSLPKEIVTTCPRSGSRYTPRRRVRSRSRSR